MDLSPLYVWNDIVVALLYTSQKKANFWYMLCFWQ